MRHKLLFSLVIAGSLQAQQTSVLFIGNSYTYVNDLPNTVRQLALSLGHTVTVASSAPGGMTFQGHVTLPATIDAINSQAWDHVVLQEQSQRPSFPQEQVEAEVFPYATELVQMIRANDPCTQPVFYMTWGRQNGDADNCDFWPPVCTFEGMNDLLQERYVQMAEDNDAYVSPVGAAWKQVRITHPLINLYQADGSHPSAEGTYLAACVFHATIFHESCVGASFVSTVQPDTAAILRAIASSVVLNNVTNWNQDVTDVDATPTGSSAVWNDYTFYHGGVGDHLWTCTNGQSFTTPDATFTFTASGLYAFSHTYTDACGHTDTAAWALDMVVGLEERQQGSRYQVWSGAAGTISVGGAQGGETFTVFDVLGRQLFAGRLGADRTHFTSPAGMHFWTISDGSGTLRSGRVLVP